MSSDNLFDRLADLFKSSGPVNWRLAREVAESVAGDHEPIEPWLAEEYRELAATAAMRIDAVSPLETSALLGDVRAVDRRTWAGDGVEDLAYLGEPLSEMLGASGGFGGLMAQLGPALVGMQMGSVTGFMSRCVLGRFDVGLPGGTSTPISFVVPNVEDFATSNGLDPRQTRLWVAMHEVAHHAEFAVPWVRERFLMLIHEFVEGLEFDPNDLAGRMEGLQDPTALQDMLQDGGMQGLFATAHGDDRASETTSWTVPRPVSSPRRPDCGRHSTRPVQPRPRGNSCSSR
jgi:putative hydrolase